MNKIYHYLILILLVLPTGLLFAQKNGKLKVVTTLPDYACFAKEIGHSKVSVTHIVQGDQDAHFIRPKPSFATALRDADVLIATGLDLELWLQTVIDNSGNSSIRSGQKGYVAATDGMKLLEKPETISRIEGGLHIYGNPHVTCSPVNMKVAARNIATGLIKNDPSNESFYEKNLKNLLHKLDCHLFGDKLVEMLGADTLCQLAQKGKLIEFLEENSYQGKSLIDYLGGWLKKMLPLRGTSIVTYHKNWIYFVKLSGLKEVGTVEPKPGIPPTPRHVTELINLMEQKDIRIILAANYFDKQKIMTVADRTNAEAVIVPIYVGGAEGTDNYFKLVDYWIDNLLAAAKKKDILNE